MKSELNRRKTKKIKALFKFKGSSTESMEVRAKIAELAMEGERKYTSSLRVNFFSFRKKLMPQSSEAKSGAFIMGIAAL